MDIEEGEAVEAFDGTDHLDCIAQRLVEVLGDAQREFEGGVCTDKLGSKFGGYGSFLPTELRAPSVLAQTKPATAPLTMTNAKEKISPVHVGERMKRMEIAASVTDAGRGGTSAIDKALVGQRHSASEHAVNLSVGLNGRNKEIQSGELHNVVKEADFDRNTETNNTNHCPSTSDRGLVSVDVPFENTRSRGTAAVGDTSSKTQNYVDNRDSDKMEQKKATRITFRIKKDPEDSRRKNKPIYSGLGLNDSSSLSLEAAEEDDTYLSDAYSSPHLSPLTMIQVAMSQLQSKYHLVLSPLHEFFGPPTDVKDTLLTPVKGSSIVLASAVQSSRDLENGLHKSESLTGSKLCEGRDKKENLQTKPKVKMAELKSTSSDGVPKARLQMEKTKFIQEVTADTRRNLHEAAKECERVEHEFVQDIRSIQKNPGLTSDAAETFVHNLNPSKQEKELNAFEMPGKISRNEKGKLKSKDRVITCESIEERNECRALEVSVTYPMNMETSLLVQEKEAQATVQRKEVCNASREANILQKEGSNAHFHDHGVGKVDLVVGKELGRDSSTKPSKGEKEEKGHFERKDKSSTLGPAGSSKDVVSNLKKDTVRKETALKFSAEKLSKDIFQAKEPSKDSLTVTYKERVGKKDHFKKVAKQSSFVLEKNAKEVVNIATREHEHVTTSSEYLETGVKNIGKNSKNLKLARKEFKATQDNGKDGKLLKESGTKNTEVILAETNSAENKISNSERLNVSASITEPVPVPAASAPVATLVLDNWVMCDKCGQWRLLLPEIDIDKLPKKFFCKMMTWLPGMNSCKYKEDETSNAVYAYLGIPNPKDAHSNALATQPQPVSVPPVPLMPAPSSFLNPSNTTEKTQETKQNTASYKKGLAGKVALPVLSKSSSFSKKGDSESMKSKNLNDVDNVFQDREQASQELRVQGDDKTSMPLLKPKRRQAKTSSVEDFESVPAVKKIKLAEAGNPYFLETYAVSSIPRENVARNHDNEIGHYHEKLDLPSKCTSKTTNYFNESKKIESSADFPNAGNHLKEGRYDEGAAANKRLQSRALEEQSNQGSPRDTGGANNRQHSSKLGEAKVDRKFKVRLKRDENIRKEGKRRLEDDASNSRFRNEKNMRNTDAYGVNSRKVKGELGTRPLGSLRKECFPTDNLQDLKQPEGTNDDEPESSVRGTFTKTTYTHNKAAAQKMRRQKPTSASPSSSSSPVSSPESSRKSKGLVSPVESTVSCSPAKVHKADKPAIERSIARNDGNLLSSSSAPTYSVVHPRIRKPLNQKLDNHYHVSGPGKKKLRSRESDFLFSDEIGEVRPDLARDMNNVRSNALLDASSNSDHNDYEQDESEEQHGVFPHILETRSYDTTRYRNGRCSEHERAENLREKDGRNGRYDRNNDSIKEKDLKRDRDSHEKTSEKWTSDMDCDGCEERFTRKQEVRDARAGVVSSGETRPDTLFEFDFHGKRAGSRAGHVDRSASSEGKETLNGITCDMKQESRVRKMEGAGKHSLQFQQEDGLRTANGRNFSESCEKIDNMHWKEGKIGPVRSIVGKLAAITGTKESEAVATRNADEQHPLSKSDTRTRMDQDNGMSYAKTKSKNHNDLVMTNHCGESLTQGKEVSKGPEDGPETRNNFPRISPANGHMIREGDVGVASNIRGQPTHQAGILIKEARSLKHTADRLEGSEAIRGDIYLHAALKFLQGAAILETSQDAGSKHEVLSLYSDTAKLCEFCATIYAKDVKATALALKCAAVARMRVLQVKNPSTTRTLAEIQGTMQLANPSQLEESPSSSSSDVDNLNNQALPHEKLQPISTAKELASPLQTSMSSIPASARHHPHITRVLRDAGEMCTAFDTWRRADHAIAAAKISCSEGLPGDAIRRVGELSFSDVEILVRLVNSALEAIRP